MKLFKSQNTIEVCEKNLENLGYRWIEQSKREFDQGSDYLCFINDEEWKRILLNPSNGHFTVICSQTDEIIATHQSCDLDEEKWYADILDALYK